MINEKAHYEIFEQLMCAVEGTLEIILVPHVYRQEVANGRNTNRNYFEYDVKTYKELLIERPEYKDYVKRTSPIDFFRPNQRNFPHFKEIYK